MKLAISYGSYSPPTICDRLLFTKLAEHANHETHVILLTDDKFDRMHPMGILEKQEVLSVMISRNIELLMNQPHLLSFLEHESSKYDEITIVHTTEFPISAKKAIRKYSKVPVKFAEYDVGKEEVANDMLMASIYGEDYEGFRKYYGGDDNTAIEFFNKFKDRVKCLS